VYVLFVLESQVNLDPQAVETAELILLFDKLFDSLNSSRRTSAPSKPLKAAVTKTSNHVQFWQETIRILQTMKYHCQKKTNLLSSHRLKTQYIH